jgi:hypothetical protein
MSFLWGGGYYGFWTNILYILLNRNMFNSYYDVINQRHYTVLIFFVKQFTNSLRNQHK